MKALYAYKVIFTHAQGNRVEIPVVETTPCRAKGVALTRHAALLKAEPSLPQEQWRLGAVLSIRQVGVIP